jgi:hypothetical protein
MERGIGLFMVGDWLVWKIVRENIVTWMWGHVADRTQIVSNMSMDSCKLASINIDNIRL